MFLTSTKRLIGAIVTAIVLAVAIPATASANVVRSGNTFTVSPPIVYPGTSIPLASTMVYGGYTFIGIPPNPWTVSFFGLPAGTVTASDLIDTLKSDPNFGKVIQEVQTSVSVESEVSGTVEDSE